MVLACLIYLLAYAARARRYTALPNRTWNNYHNTSTRFLHEVRVHAHAYELCFDFAGTVVALRDPTARVASIAELEELVTRVTCKRERIDGGPVAVDSREFTHI
jgi:hypothetical protein